jgi:hypothetical protein
VPCPVTCALAKLHAIRRAAAINALDADRIFRISKIPKKLSFTDLKFSLIIVDFLSLIADLAASRLGHAKPEITLESKTRTYNAN